MAKLTGKDNSYIGIFSDFFSQSPYPNYIKGTDFKFLCVSKSMASYFGVDDPSTLIGKDCSALIKNPFVAKMYEDLDKEVIEGTDTLERILPSFIDEDGVQRYVRVSKSVIRDANDEIIGILGNLFDYTMTYEAKNRFDKQAAKFLNLPNKALSCAFIDVTDWNLIDMTHIMDNHLVHEKYTVAEFLISCDRMWLGDTKIHKFLTSISKTDILKKFNSGEIGYSEEFLTETDGNSSWIKFEYIFITNPENEHVCILFSIYDVSAQRNEMDSLVKAAEQDSMTELLNHESAMNKIRLYIDQENRDNLNALFIIDIDDFKNINDKFGHRTGDTVICEFAQRISDSFKETDIVGRIGGDEFIVLMKDIDSVWTATNKAAELVNTLQYECRREGRSIFLTASIGLALFSEKVVLEDLYSEADEALYNAKNTGKNKYILSDNGDFSSFDSSSHVGDIAIDLKTVLNGIDGIMFIAEIEDDDVKILYSSNAHYNQMIIEQMPADEYSRLLYVIKRSYTLAPEESFEYTSIKPVTLRGKPRWIHAKGNFLTSDNPDKIKFSIIVTDVYNFKNTQQQLEIQNTKNNLALSISNMIIWEYDISTRFITLHNSEEKSIPYWKNDMCFSQSKDDYIALYTKIDEGATEGSSFIHFKNFFGYQTWMQVSFKTTYNDNGRLSGALFAAVDVTSLMNIMDKYESLIRRYDKLMSDNKTGFHLNLTNNEIISYSLNDGLPKLPASVKSADDFFKFVVSFVSCSEERKEYLEAILTTSNSIDRLDIGTESADEELFLQLDSNDCEWFNLRMFYLTNPETKDKELIGFLRNVHAERTSKMIIDSFISFEYELLAVIDTVKEQIKILKETANKYIGETDTYDFNSFLYDSLPDYIVENELQDCAYKMDVHTITKELATKNVYSTSVSVYEANSENQIEIHRKRYQYTYIDDEKRYIAVTKSDITDQYKSEFDQVSGLYNRNAFYARAKELIESNPRTSYVIVRWDIDRFKVYNDTFGTVAGDELLAMIGNSYRDIVTDDMIVASLGADNFVICMPNNNFNPEEHCEYLTNLLSSISDRYSLSFHMAGYKVTDSSVDISIMCDRALIAAKSIKDQISTRFIWYDDSMRDNVVHEQELINDIKLALDNDEFCIYVQPQFNQISNKLVSGEVLVRWHKSDGTIVSPGVFIPLMEKSGLVSRLDEIIWDKAAEYISKRIHANQPITPLAVNISRRDFYRPHFCDIFYNLIKKYDISPEYLDLEVTESAYIEDADLINDIINELRAYGFKFKMDDFGTGYSSLNTLKNVPVDMIKLDMKFIDIDANDETANFRGGVILDSILRMSHWLGIPVIAEGVENAQQAEFLKSIDCAIIQGYYFSEPLSLEDYSKLLDESAQDDKFSVLNVNNSFDNYDFWDPTSYSAILFNSFIGPAGIFEHYNGKITPLRLNELFYSALGTSPEKYDFYNADIESLIHEDDHAKFIDCIKEVSQSSEEHFYEFKWYMPNKENRTKKDYYWLRLRIRRIAHNDKRFVFFVGLENITMRKLLELHNSTLAERLGLFIEIVPRGVCSFRISDKIEVSYTNSKLYNMFGYDKNNEADVKDFHPILGIHPEDQDSVFDSLWSDIGNEPMDLKVRHICKDGTYKWVYIQIFKSSVDDEGTVGYCLYKDASGDTQHHQDLYEIETIASHSDRLISRFDLKTGRLVHYFQFSDYFDVPEDAPVETIEDIAKYNLIKAEVDDESFKAAMIEGTTKDNVILLMREKNKQYSTFVCRTTLVKDSDGNALFAIMSLQKTEEQS